MIFSWVAMLVPRNNTVFGKYFCRWPITQWVGREVSVNQLLVRVGRASHMSGFSFPVIVEAAACTVFLYLNTHPWYNPLQHLYYHSLFVWPSYQSGLTPYFAQLKDATVNENLLYNQYPITKIPHENIFKAFLLALF